MDAKKLTYTVGYSGRTIDEFVRLLASAGIDRVVDVRELPLSRKKGFSKTSLGGALAKQGIEYVHLRAAGNPYRAEKHDVPRCLAMYSGHLDAHPQVMADVEGAIDGHRAALLCFESHADECHRSILGARLLARDPNRTLRHL